MACATQRMLKQPVPAEAVIAKFLMSFPREPFHTCYHNSLLEELSTFCVTAFGRTLVSPGFSSCAFPFVGLDLYTAAVRYPSPKVAVHESLVKPESEGTWKDPDMTICIC